jgi:hypothetical protein
MGSLKYDERKTQQHTQTWSTKHNKDNRRDRSRATTGEREIEKSFFLPSFPSPPCRFASFLQGRKAAVAGPMLPARFLCCCPPPSPQQWAAQTTCQKFQCFLFFLGVFVCSQIGNYPQELGRM